MHMTRAYNLMESGLTLLGVTAVEDRLQDDVQETLECLRVAGIKVSLLYRRYTKIINPLLFNFQVTYWFYQPVIEF